MGVLKRQISLQGSPKVEYTLSELGQRSEPMLRQMYAWGRWYCEQLGVEYEWPVRDEAEERMHWLCDLIAIDASLPQQGV
jgi:DNA-binding HxlR family transcriptional regulator